ncbi:glycosyltransferase family 2 protein [Heliophilum fasciatum]|uniref:Glycosyltransferase involved in cell wall biosynthesis n=1 Tax=Heliophilum fasciatum TaxID=35700 RepID=A0A4R2RP05_9FIRM|nr:glycosyltransferase family 2 protein [Heliophilum fasciatum]MCW2278992.1 glycosyltransferase involved in cell wall biosynthesis [Heliophilum fasciatum]TCP64057.1 glycosyltransferase involved in cell wall biosynthesis [Heliophilum fasciatum]
MRNLRKSSVRIAVVIPCYRVKKNILGVINNIDATVWRIYVVDDKCPEESGRYVEANCKDPRVTVLRHEVNQGVGGAVITGYQYSINDGADVIVKLDGDGQMDPALIPYIVKPILTGEADYTKGNRFFNLEKILIMPKLRLFGNAMLSLLTKLSSGYWNLFDPTNGYTAIHSEILKILPLGKVSRRYFFETDMLFRLNTIRAVVVDVPMDAKYGDENSNLKISKILGEFLVKHMLNLIKRIFYNYYLRDMSLASLELPLGITLFLGGISFGGWHWWKAIGQGITTPLGTIMISVLSILIGLQFLLSFIAYDISIVPRRSLHKTRF